MLEVCEKNMAKKQAYGITREEILDKGMQIFRNKGPKTTLKGVASAANVSRQMVYNYFKTRGGLLAALAQRLDETSGIEEQFTCALKLKDTEARLRTFVQDWQNYMQEIRELANELNRAGAVDSASKEAYEERMSAARERFKILVSSLEPDLSSLAKREELVDITLSILSPQTYEIFHIERGWTHEMIVDLTSEMLVKILLK